MFRQASNNQTNKPVRTVSTVSLSRRIHLASLLSSLLGATQLLSPATPNASAQDNNKNLINDKSILSANFIYESAPFPSCHASSIEETANGLVATWFGGTHEKHPDVGIWVSRLTYSDNDAKSINSKTTNPTGPWSTPVEVANGKGASPDGKQLPTWNPVLFQPKFGSEPQPLVLFYKVGPSPETWWGMMTTSLDQGLSWSEPKRLPDGFLGPIKNKPVERSDGAWLCPSSTETEEEPSRWNVHFEITHDQGKTWMRSPALDQKPLNDGLALQAIQPALLNLGPKHWLAVGRSRQDKIFETESKDDGTTWTPLTLGKLPNNNSGLDTVTLRNGKHLMVYNHVAGTPGQWGGKRTPLNVAWSADGKSWKPWLVLENTPGEFSYPAIIQSKNGLVHITYTWNRKKIKHVVVDPQVLEQQN